MSTEIELAEKKSVGRFDILKEASGRHVTLLKGIKVTDDTSMAIATQKLSDAKAFNQEVEALRIIAKEPYLKTGRKIDETAKMFSLPIQSEMDRLADEVLKYKQAQQKIREEKAAAALLIQNKIIAYQSETIVEINKCETVPELGEVFKKRIGKDNAAFPADKEWGEFVADAHVMLQVIKDHGKLRRKQIEDLANTPVEKKEELIQAQQKESAENYVATATPVLKKSEAAINEAKVTKTTGTRKDWGFQMSNRAEVPEKFLMVDETKVREYMRQEVKEGRFESGKEYTVFGFTFKQEESLSIK